jgi:glucose-1-phosphate adenylyltransferase
LISQGNSVFKMLFDDLYEYHINKNADITIVCREMKDMSHGDLSQLGILSVEDTGRVIDMQEKPLSPNGNLGSMGIYFIKRSLLITLLEESAAHANYDFVLDILIKKLDTLKIFAYEFEGYWRSLNTIRSYYRCNMEFLQPRLNHHLFIENGKVYTKVKDEAPAKYNEEAEVKNSIIADGCIIEGVVENSVLFRGVAVKKGAVVRDSIVMQGSCIEPMAMLQNVILDKNVVITEGKLLKGEENWPVIVGRRVRV